MQPSLNPSKHTSIILIFSSLQRMLFPLSKPRATPFAPLSTMETLITNLIAFTETYDSIITSSSSPPWVSCSVSALWGGWFWGKLITEFRFDREGMGEGMGEGIEQCEWRGVCYYAEGKELCTFISWWSQPCGLWQEVSSTPQCSKSYKSLSNLLGIRNIPSESANLSQGHRAAAFLISS